MKLKLRYYHMLIDSMIICSSCMIALYLTHTLKKDLMFILFVEMGIRMAVNTTTNIYNMVWRYISATDSVRLATSIFFSSVLSLCALFATIENLPLSYFLLSSLGILVLSFNVRLLRRVLFDYTLTKEIKRHGKNTLIIGAGNNGRTLAKRMRSDYAQKSHAIGFLDDDKDLVRKTIEGLPVLGNVADLESICQAHKVKQVAIAIEHLDGIIVSQIFDTCLKLNIKTQIINPSIDNEINLLKPVSLENLLNRPVSNNLVDLIAKNIQGKCILVTGAGGSIGSELSRQICNYGVKKLLLIDHNEYNLYKIHHELTANNHTDIIIVPLLCDLKSYVHLKDIFETHRPEAVYHAAAYKHVHLVEANPYSSILNNIQSTKNLVELCEMYKIRKFTLVSSDKAVNPVGVMGATKRACEIIVSVYGLKHSYDFHSVRFGNVLGSSGSLIPLLKEQIKKGGPVTITHKDMTRYFMLIPEAVSLVLNASAISAPGDLNVLKMGEPVNILSITKRLIALMGHEEDAIPIQFIGLRPGEKMYEELYINGNELDTRHPDILTLKKGDNLGCSNPDELYNLLLHKLDQIVELSRQQRTEALHLLNSLIDGSWSDLTSKKEKSMLKILSEFN